MRTARYIPTLRRGFTLMESLMAAGLLLIIVTAVGMAVSSGQQHAYWTQQRIAGTLAAEDLMARILATPYNDLVNVWHTRSEAPGAMVDFSGNPMPPSFGGVGRIVTVTNTYSLNPAGSMIVEGRTVTVRAVDEDLNDLAVVERFVPKPIVASVEEEPMASF